MHNSSNSHIGCHWSRLPSLTVLSEKVTWSSSLFPQLQAGPDTFLLAQAHSELGDINAHFGDLAATAHCWRDALEAVKGAYKSLERGGIFLNASFLKPVPQKELCMRIRLENETEPSVLLTERIARWPES